MPATDPTWNFQDPASKERTLGVLQGETDALWIGRSRWVCGRRVTGGDMRADVSSDGVQFAPWNIDDCPAVLEFDPATLVLAGYARVNGGTARGDAELAGRFRDLFFPI